MNSRLTDDGDELDNEIFDFVRAAQRKDGNIPFAISNGNTRPGGCLRGLKFFPGNSRFSPSIFMIDFTLQKKAAFLRVSMVRYAATTMARKGGAERAFRWFSGVSGP